MRVYKETYAMFTLAYKKQIRLHPYTRGGGGGNAESILCEWRWMPDLLDEAEIAEFYRCLLLDKYIFRFNVSMEEPVAVDII